LWGSLIDTHGIFAYIPSKKTRVLAKKNIELAVNGMKTDGLYLAASRLFTRLYQALWRIRASFIALSVFSDQPTDQIYYVCLAAILITIVYGNESKAYAARVVC